MSFVDTNSQQLAQRDEELMLSVDTPIVAHDLVSVPNKLNNFKICLLMDSLSYATQTDFDSKSSRDASKAAMARKNDHSNWEASKHSLERIFGTGKAAIKLTDPENVTHLILDIDGCPTLSVETILQSAFGRYIVAIEHSFSRQTNRYHVLIKFATPVNKWFIEKYFKPFINYIFKDHEYDGVKNDQPKRFTVVAPESYTIGQPFFSTSEPEKTLRFPNAEAIDPELVISFCFDKKLNAGDGSDLSDVSEDSLEDVELTAISEKYQSHTTDFLDNHLQPKLLMEWCGGDAVALMTQHYPEGQIKNRRNERFFDSEEITRFDCHNPRSGDYADQSGTSFHVIAVKNRMPVAIDRANGMRFITFIDYFFAWRMREDEDFRAKFADSRELDGSFKHGFYGKLRDEICEFYGIEPYTCSFRSDDIIMDCLKYFANRKGYLVNGGNNKDVIQMWLFVKRYRRWIETDNYAFGKMHLASLVKKVYPKISSLINLELAQSRSTKRVTERSVDVYIREYVTGSLLVDHFNLRSEFTPKVSLIPVGDSYLHSGSKALIPLDGSGRNFATPYKNLDFNITDADPDIQAFKSLWSKWSGCPVMGEALLLFAILCINRQAHTLRHVPVLIGGTKAGKSAVMKLIIRLMRQDFEPVDYYSDDVEDYDNDDNETVDVATRVPASKFFGAGKTQFDNASYCKKFFIGVDEISSKLKIEDIIEPVKDAVSDDANSVLVEPKGREQYTVKSQYALMLVFEQKMQIRTDAGLDGRLDYFILGKTFKDEAFYKRLKNNEDGILDKILAWCLLQDVATAKARYLELVNHEVFKKAKREKKSDSDRVFKWIDYCLHSGYMEITNCKDDKVSVSALYEHFNHWYQNDDPGASKIFSGKTSFNRELKDTFQDDNLFDVTLDYDFLDKPYGKNKEKHYFGIKLIENL